MCSYVLDFGLKAYLRTLGPKYLIYGYLDPLRFVMGYDSPGFLLEGLKGRIGGPEGSGCADVRGISLQFVSLLC